jgi:hypothetical protein
MVLTLASTWHPRGENQRLVRLWPILKEVYGPMIFCLHPGSDPAEIDRLAQQLGPQACFVIVKDWPTGRYEAMKRAVQSGDAPVQYADLDRLLRWVETRPDEWRRTAEAIVQNDCLVIGRTPTAYATHPEALIWTERISNLVISRLLGIDLDLSAGSKGFSHTAAQFILDNSAPIRALGTDAEWPILCHRAGFQVKGCLVEGLDWESADRYADQAAGSDAQSQAARLYDQNAEHWAWRVQVAEEIIQAGLDAMRRPLKPTD